MAWSAPASNGYPILFYTVRMYNFTNWVESNTTNVKYTAANLLLNTAYPFEVSATNKLGASGFSAPLNFSTAPSIFAFYSLLLLIYCLVLCGDGVCDAPSETCTSCSLDCGACGKIELFDFRELISM